MLRMRYCGAVAALLFVLVGCVNAGASEQPLLLHTEVDGAEDSDIFVPQGFKVEKVLSVTEQQGSWISLTQDNKGRFITADQSGLLYRVTLQGKTPLVEPISVSVNGTDGKPAGKPIGAAQGLLWAFDSLYVLVNGDAGLGSGLYRLRSAAGNDTLDTAELLAAIPGSGEHGPHNVTLGPDGFLYVCGGNDSGLPKWQSSHVPKNWGGDQLLALEAQSQDWHSKNGAVPGGWVCRTDKDGKNWEIYCAGFRNHYRLAFNPDGELFTSDGNDEWQIGMPWYRAPRICHVVSGGDFGWRSTVYKWPPYFPDGSSAVVDLPNGGPSGIVFGTGAKFPAKYQRALFALDWGYGKIYAVHLQNSGASYTGSVELFMRGRPLAFTDAIVGQDGALYFLIGGRSIQSALFRVTYVGTEDTAPVAAAVDEAAKTARALRQSLEALHGAAAPTAVETAWAHLDDTDASIRFAARVALEHQDPKTWSERVFGKNEAQTTLTASVALARCGDKAFKPRLMTLLNALDWKSLSEAQRVELLRAYQLVFIRMGKLERTDEAKLAQSLNAHYPSGVDLVDRELNRLLVFLQADDVVDKTLPLLRSTKTQEEQLQLGYALSGLLKSMNFTQREKYVAWLTAANGYVGGREVQDIVKELKQATIAASASIERAKWEKVFQEQAPTVPPVRRLVKQWTVAELTPVVTANLKGRDYEKGRHVYIESSCIRCHYFNGEGSEIGPDLTSVSARFNIKAILESIIEPNKVISDQYSARTLKMKDGRKLYGRVMSETNGKYEFAPDPMEPGKSIGVDKNDVESIKKSIVSVMPEGLLTCYTQDEILDLMAFLISGGDKDDKVFKKDAAVPHK